MGSAVFLGAVLWTIATTGEYPPDGAAPKRGGLIESAREIAASIAAMPRTMRQLAWVQIATWLGLFCMWLYFPVAVAYHVFGAPGPESPRYAEGVEWGGVCFGVYSAVCFIFSFALEPLGRRLGKRRAHGLCLLAGAAGLLSVAGIHDKYWLLASMMGVGIAWASTLAMPYAMLAGALPPEKTGVYMGIFNFFIVTPEILASLGFGWVMNHLLGNDRVAAVMIGGAFLIVAALLAQRVEERN